MAQQLTDEFLVELLKSCLVSKKILDICILNLKNEYVPIEALKKIWKNIQTHYQLNGTLPTFGILSEKIKDDDKAIEYLLQMKKLNVAEKKTEILQQFDTFIQRARFVDLYTKVGNEYQKGNKEEAISLLAEEAQKITESSIKEGAYTTVFSDFNSRQQERHKKQHHDFYDKITFGIHPLDYYTNGGGDRGRSALFMARSGGFKSTLLKWIGISNARLGKRVVHFQCEGTEDECLEAYDAGWTAVDLSDIEFGQLPKKSENTIKQVNSDIIKSGGEIFVVAPEKIDSLYIDDCYETIIDIEKVYGKVDLAIFDYLEIFNIKGKYYDKENGERKRRSDIANKITNIAALLNLLSISATQANNIIPEQYNNPDFVMTRNNVSEFKGSINPFSLFATLNQTDDEYESEIIRVHIDKLRKYKTNRTFKIYQSHNNSRFYDSKRTIGSFWDVNNNVQIK